MTEMEQLERAALEAYRDEATLRRQHRAGITRARERIVELEAQIAARQHRLYGTDYARVEEGLEAAIKAEIPVEFWYRNAADEASYRTVSPYLLKQTRSNAEMLVGFDHDREGVRHFHVERITELGWSGEHFAHQVERESNLTD